MNENVVTNLQLITKPQITDGTTVFRRLAQLGYSPLPIVPHDCHFHARDGMKPGGKAPGRYNAQARQWEGLTGWRRFLDHPPEHHTLSRWEAYSAQSGNQPGAGVLTGRIAAVDIDVTHPKLAKCIKGAADNRLGQTPFIRIGNAPKIMLIYRVEDKDSIRKMRSCGFDLEGHENQAVEILGEGQQFVAYGMHPGTHKPYYWPLKSLIDCRIDELPPVSAEKLQAFIEHFEFIAADIFDARQKGTPGMRDHTPKAPVELADAMGLIDGAVRTIKNDDLHYDEWVKIGHAIKAALPHDEGLALELFDEFSAKSSKYDPELTFNKFATFSPKRIGAGTLYKLAADDGWLPPHEIHAEAGLDFEPVTLAENTGDWLAPYEDDQLPAREWLLGRYLLKDYVTALVAPGGVGKSTLTLTWAASLASGRNLAAAAPHAPARTWLINNEDDITELKRRFSAVRRLHGIPWDELAGKIAFSDCANKKWKIAARNDKGQLQPAPGFHHAIERIKRDQITCLIVDPLVSTHEANENDNNEMEYVMHLYRRIAKETNCAVCLVHHTSKPQGGSSEGFAGNANAGRGASAIVNAVRVALTLFDMSERDAERYGINEELRARYVRLDDAKANLALKAARATWLYRESVTIGNGEEIGALRPERLVERENVETEEVGRALADMEALKTGGRVSVADAAKWCQQALAIDHEIGLEAAKKRLVKMLQKPVCVLTESDLWVWYEHNEEASGRGKTSHFICLGKRPAEVQPSSTDP